MFLGYLQKIVALENLRSDSNVHSMSTLLVRAINVHKSFPTSEGFLHVLQGVDMDITRGQSIALTGESGSGKSTLLHCLGCLEKPSKGSILLDDQELNGLAESALAEIRRSKLSFVFQQFNLIPSLTVEQNLRLSSRLAAREDAIWQREITARLGLENLLNEYPENLSGGQQQRVAIGRAIAHKPPLVLADEPTGNLDQDTADTVLSLLLELVAETGASLLMVTHSPRIAARLDRRLHLEGGRIV